MKKLALSIFLFLVFSACLSIGGNAWFESHADAEQERLGLPKLAGNAIKHSYAAAFTYSSLRKMRFGVDFSEEATIWLGILSETVENTIKMGDFADSGLEIMKDLHNNMVGIEVSKWLEANPNVKTTELELLGTLARDNVLIIDRNDLYSEQEKHLMSKSLANLPHAIEWFNRKKTEISKNVREYLI